MSFLQAGLRMLLRGYFWEYVSIQHQVSSFTGYSYSQTLLELHLSFQRYYRGNIHALGGNCEGPESIVTVVKVPYISSGRASRSATFTLTINPVQRGLGHVV